MKVVFANTFEKSFMRMVNSEKWWRWEYWRSKYYDVKWAIWALRKYFTTVVKMRPWDFSYVLEMMKLQIGFLCDQIETREMEIDETRIPKQDKMKKFIELAEFYLKGNYAERCGRIYDEEETKFIETEESKDKPEKEKSYELITVGGQSKKEISEILKKARKLEDDEWNEMFELLKDGRSWWD